MSASGTITALRAKVTEQEEEIARLKRELAGRVTIPKPANIVEEAFAVAAGARECVHGAIYGACRKLGCAPK